MQYTFTKTANLDKLTNEIRASVITVALDYINQTGTSLDVFFKSALSVSEEAILGVLVVNHINTPNEIPIATVKIEGKKTSLGRQEVSIFEPEGAAATVASHDFCDKTTWYTTSALITLEALTTADTLTFSSTSQFWIDLTHNKMYDEDTVVASDPTMIPKIYVDDVLQSQSAYTIDYAAGTVTFNSSVIGVVTATYRKAVNSYYILRPRPGQILSIRTAEVQFGEDTVINTPIIFEAWVNHPTYGMVPVPGTRIAYKSEKDFMTACNGGQGLIPAWGNYGKNVHVFPFEYARPKPMKSSDKVEIRIYTLNHVPLVGTYATGTFYVTVETEIV